MIKYLKYMFMAAITLIAATGCQEDIEDTFSKPTVPVLVNNGTILMTQNTMSETIVWTWSAARFMQGEVSYALYVKYEDEAAKQVGSTTKELSIAMSKTDFQTLLKGFTTIPQNTSFNVSFYVEASDANGKYLSDEQDMKVYSYGDAVSAVPVATANEVILDVTKLTETLELLTWEPARLGYGETITYNVYISYGDGELVEVATGLTETACSKTVDEWNELAVKAGAPEQQAANLKLTVKAYSETYPDGVPSAPAVVNITTYKATYPNVLSITGTNKTIPQSTSTKGLYDCFVNLEGSGNVAFKFLDKDAQTEYGSDDVQTVTDDKGNEVTSGTIGGNGNITLPAGLYRISADIKFNKLQIVKIESMGLIGDATVGAWNDETLMTYDATANTYSVVTTMTKDKEYKFRANNNWGFAIDKNGDFRDGGDNYKFEKETGEYKIVLDLNKHPYSAKILSTSFPEQLYVPGAHSNWAVPFPIFLSGNGEGVYEGGINLVDPNGDNCKWKFSPNDNGDDKGDFAGTIEFNELGYGKGECGGGGNIVTPNGYYYVTVDMTAGTFEMLKINKVGLIGGFNGWGGDVDFTYDATKNVWTLTQALTATDEFKVRFNGDWDKPNYQNRGLAAGGIVPMGVAMPVYHGGSNMKVAEDGTYTITLDLSTNPNTITITK